MGSSDAVPAFRHPGYETPRMTVCAHPLALPRETDLDADDASGVLATDSTPEPTASLRKAVGARDSYADLREEFIADRDSDPRVERERA
jgi:hypothetical protein